MERLGEARGLGGGGGWGGGVVLAASASASREYGWVETIYSLQHEL